LKLNETIKKANYDEMIIKKNKTKNNLINIVCRKEVVSTKKY